VTLLWVCHVLPVQQVTAEAGLDVGAIRRTIERDEAAAVSEGATPDWFIQDRLSAGICCGEDLEAIWICYLGWHKTPAHHNQVSLAALGIGSKHWLEGRRRNVVVRRKLEARWELANFECFGNALFVRSAIVSSTHLLLPYHQCFDAIEREKMF
jgi:hypothetical protein